MVERGTYIGRYEILAPLGDAVYLARDPVRHRPVAIRILEASLNAARRPGSETTSDRRHAAALVSLRHSHIVPFIEAIEVGSRICAVTEYVRGKSLDRLIATRADISLADKLRWIAEVIKAVAVAHEQGIVHGHISPNTIVIDELNNAQLLGFDIQLLHAFSRLSGFEAPEVMRGEPPVPASDVFSIGAVAHAILTSARSLERDRQVVRAPVPYEMTPIDDTLAGGPGVIKTIRGALEILPERRVPLQELDSRFSIAHRWHQPVAAEGQKTPPMDYDPLGDLFSPPRTASDPVDEPSTASSEQVQFTVYRPRAVRPGEWRPMLAYVHLADSRPDAPPDAPTPLEQVQALADRALGSELERFRGTTADATQDVPREGEITIIPTVAGVEFNPERRTFKWVQDVQEERFLLRAGPALHGRTARGRVSAYLGVLLIAEVDLAIRVDAALVETATAPVEAVRARTFRNIFASYSHADTEIVRQFEAYAATLGDRYLRDVRDLRAGQAWQPALLRLIDRADVFQLFWSSTAMRSRHVRTEWEYALSLKREDFVRPTYWEDPLPSAPEEGLPPEALSAIEFQRISLGASNVDPDEAQKLKSRVEIERSRRERETREAARRTTSTAPPPALTPRPTDHDTGSIPRPDLPLPPRSEAPLERMSTMRWLVIALVVIALILALLLAT